MSNVSQTASESGSPGRRPMVAGNWKLHGSRASAAALADAVVDGVTAESAMACEVVVCPVAVHLADVHTRLSARVALGAQNCAVAESGAYTGEVSAPMLAEYGVSHVILGHSERRQLFAETDAAVADKVQAVLAASMTPIVCIGETLEERESGDMHSVLSRQLDAVVSVLPAEQLARLVIAYEPVWAIGTGKTATPGQAQEVHAWIRERLPAAVASGMRILYGGSVKPDNAATLFAEADIDGGLIGGAALKADDFLGICRAAG